MKRRCLFVGGPFDGQWREVDISRREIVLVEEPTLEATVVNEISATTEITFFEHTYRCEPWTEIKTRHYVYVHSSVQDGQVMEKLLGGYKPTNYVDVEAGFWKQIKDSAKAAKWMPADYEMNDWVHDICGWLRFGGGRVWMP